MKKVIQAFIGFIVALLIMMGFAYYSSIKHFNSNSLSQRIKTMLESNFKGIEVSSSKPILNGKKVSIQSIDIKYKKKNLLYLEALKTEIDFKSFLLFHSSSEIQIRNLRINWPILFDYWKSGWSPSLSQVEILRLFKRIIWQLNVDHLLIFDEKLENTLLDCSKFYLEDIHHDSFMKGELICNWSSEKKEGELKAELGMDLNRLSHNRKSAIQIKWENQTDYLKSTKKYLHKGQSRILVNDKFLKLDTQINSKESQIQFSSNLKNEVWTLDELVGEFDKDEALLVFPNLEKKLNKLNIEDSSKFGINLTGVINFAEKTLQSKGEIKTLNEVKREFNHKQEKISSMWRIVDKSLIELVGFSYFEGDIQIAKVFEVRPFDKEGIIESEMRGIVEKVELNESHLKFIFNLIYPHFINSGFNSLKIEGKENKIQSDLINFEIKSFEQNKKILMGEIIWGSDKLKYNYDGKRHQLELKNLPKFKLDKLSSEKIEGEIFTGEVLYQANESKLIPYSIEGSE